MNVNCTMLVHNRPRLTMQALNSIGKHEGMNLTILAHNCDSETSEMLEKWFEEQKEDGLEYHIQFNNEEMGTGDARNRVIQSSEDSFGRDQYLYLSDNDVTFQVGWLQTLVNAYEKAAEQGFKVIGGYNHPYHLPIASVRVGYVGADGPQLNADFVVNEVYALALQSMLMTWDVWDKYGPFQSTRPGAVCQGEDCEFGNAIRADGGRLGVISPPLLVNCGVTNSFGELIPGHDLVRKQAPSGVIVE